MQLLLLLLSVMTFTVQSKSAVEVSGTCPPLLEVSYSCTYQKGDVRAGDTATLSLTGLNGIALETVAIYMKSNKSSGAGKITITADGSVIEQEEGTYAEWFGGYNNTDFQPIGWSGSQKANTLQVQITGTANSLHIEKYEIQYSEGARYTVTLMNGNEVYQELKEKSGGGGVVLPVLSSTGEWQFMGWSETEFWEVTSIPQFHAPQSTFRPSHDCRLWAVYQKGSSLKQLYVKDLTEWGIYIYFHSVTHKAMSGTPVDGRMESAPLDLNDEKQYYRVQYINPDTAYIFDMRSETPIGYSGTKLAAVLSPWKVYHEGEETLFYTEINKKNYVLWPDLTDEGGNEWYTGLRQADPGSSPIRLIAPMEQHISYTCHPEAEGIEATHAGADGKERVLMNIGNYELIIKNGKKQLRLR
ncbi:MAG: hypothetical protein IJV28_04280 [Paludibacteraceae bacterium]|nr:hypothetical protein [Paludibacteraceae bacterium]